MDIVVCIKQVPDASEIKVNEGDFTLVREGVATSISLMDKNAIELALQLRDQKGGKVTALSMGPAGAKAALQEAIAMGVDEALHISDPGLKGSDALATAHVLAKGIQGNLGSAELILFGCQSFDGSTGLVAPAVAAELGMPVVSNIFKLEGVEGGKAVVERNNDNGSVKLEVQLPAVFSCEKALNEPRYPSIKGTMKAKKTPIPVVSAGDLGVAGDSVGLSASSTQVISCVKPAPRGQGEILAGSTPQELAKALVGKLREFKIV